MHRAPVSLLRPAALAVAAAVAALPIGLAAAPASAAGPGVEALKAQLTALSPRVRRDEAAQLAARAHAASAQLARDYRTVRAPHFHNFLVNAGLRKRGLCHHWARDLGDHLAALKPRTLVLRWGIAHRGTLREHNAVVVTARGQPFESGIVLDAWRHSGRLFSGPVAADKYPWKEDRSESFGVARARPTSRDPGVRPSSES